MKSRGLRLTLFALFVGLLTGAAYVIWSEEAQGRDAVAAATSFDSRARSLSRLLLDIRSSQPGYVAAGQGEDFWTARVDDLFKSTRESLTALRAQARTPQSVTDIDAASTAFDDFAQMDRRAREYVRNGQRLLASDLIFSDGIDKVDTALGALEHARTVELAARDQGLHERRRVQMKAAAGAAGLGLLIVFGLVPLPREPAAAPPAEVGDLPLKTDRETVARVQGPPSIVAPPPAPVAEPVAVIAPAPKPAVAAAPPSPPPVPTVDLQGIAALCTDLSRVVDTKAIPVVLERAAALLDASGIVIWIADPDGRELAPIVAHGYPQNLVARMGTIGRDAENVTAAAFRTCLVQTVNADAISPGAIAAPLLSPTGAVGVMAAEVLHDGERQDQTRAVAAIVAAQLSTLLGPPAPRSAKSEAAGA
jgi:hypothetical protein